MRFCLVLTACFFLAAAASAADVGGKWNIVFHTDGGDRPGVLTLTVDGTAVTGTMTAVSDAEGVPVKGTFENGELVLAFPYYSGEAGFEAELKMRGTLKEEKITGEFQFGEFGGTFEASRQ